MPHPHGFRRSVHRSRLAPSQQVSRYLLISFEKTLGSAYSDVTIMSISSFVMRRARRNAFTSFKSALTAWHREGWQRGRLGTNTTEGAKQDECQSQCLLPEHVRSVAAERSGARAAATPRAKRGGCGTGFPVEVFQQTLGTRSATAKRRQAARTPKGDARCGVLELAPALPFAKPGRTHLTTWHGGNGKPRGCHALQGTPLDEACRGSCGGLQRHDPAGSCCARCVRVVPCPRIRSR